MTATINIIVEKRNEYKQTLRIRSQYLPVKNFFLLELPCKQYADIPHIRRY